MPTQSSIPNGLSEEQNRNIANALNVFGSRMVDSFTRDGTILIKFNS